MGRERRDHGYGERELVTMDERERDYGYGVREKEIMAMGRERSWLWDERAEREIMTMG